MPDFSNTTRYYYYRHIYQPKFFEGCAQVLSLDGTQIALDVACGTGDVARGFSRFVNSIVAFDENEHMIDIAVKSSLDIENIVFLCSRFEELEVHDTFDLVTLGRAIQWLDRDFVLGALDRFLKKNGSVIVCGSGFLAGQGAWLTAYDNLMRQWCGTKENRRYDGTDVFQNSKFRCYATAAVKGTQKISVEYLVGHSLSYTNLTTIIEPNLEAYQRNLESALFPYMKSGKIDAIVSTWGKIFKIYED